MGEIKAARDAVVEVTSRLRSYLYRDFFQRDTAPQSAPGVEASSSNIIAPVHEGYTGSETPTTYQNVQSVAAQLPSKVPLDALKNALFVSFLCFISCLLFEWLCKVEGAVFSSTMSIGKCI